MRAVPEKERKRVGAEIRAERIRRKLTQEELATILGVSWVTISRWECAVKYPSKHRDMIFKVLEIKIL